MEGAEHELPSDVTTIDIFHETSSGANPLNRLCIDVARDKIAYYCEFTPEQVLIHRGDKEGPVIATTSSFEGKDGIADIRLTELGTAVSIRHKHHTIPLTHGSTFFTFDGKNYNWRKHYEFVEEGGPALALFHPARGSPHIGSIYVLPDGETMKDLAVITALIDQEISAAEKKHKVSFCLHTGSNRE